MSKNRLMEFFSAKLIRKKRDTRVWNPFSLLQIFLHKKFLEEKKKYQRWRISSWQISPMMLGWEFFWGLATCKFLRCFVYKQTMRNILSKISLAGSFFFSPLRRGKCVSFCVVQLGEENSWDPLKSASKYKDAIDDFLFGFHHCDWGPFEWIKKRNQQSRVEHVHFSVVVENLLNFRECPLFKSKKKKFHRESLGRCLVFLGVFHVFQLQNFYLRNSHVCLVVATINWTINTLTEREDEGTIKRRAKESKLLSWGFIQKLRERLLLESTWDSLLSRISLRGDLSSLKPLNHSSRWFPSERLFFELQQFGQNFGNFNYIIDKLQVKRSHYLIWLCTKSQGVLSSDFFFKFFLIGVHLWDDCPVDSLAFLPIFYVVGTL